MASTPDAPSSSDPSSPEDRADAAPDAKPASDEEASPRASEQAHLEVEILRAALTADRDAPGEAPTETRAAPSSFHTPHSRIMSAPPPTDATTVRIDDLPARPRALPPGELGDVFGGCIQHQDPCGPEADSKDECCGDLECQDLTPAGDLYRCKYP